MRTIGPSIPEANRVNDGIGAREMPVEGSGPSASRFAALAKLPSRFQGGLVCRTDGEPIDPDNFAHRDWARVLRRAGLRHLRFHNLRHTYTSLLL